MTKKQIIWSVIIIVAVIGFLIYESNKNKKEAAAAALNNAANKGVPTCAPGYRFDTASAQCIPIEVLIPNRMIKTVAYSDSVNAAGNR